MTKMATLVIHGGQQADKGHGAIFGDMTSPISDTSIVASMATNNDHIDHIRTQLPYSLVTGGIVVIFYVFLGHLLTTG